MKIFGIKVFYTILELFRIVKCSRFSFSLKTKRKHDKVLIIMNGTSIMEALKKIDADIEKFDTICVNSFVTTDLFLKIRPRYYLMIDPTYWLDSVEPEVEITRESIYSDLISKVDWEMYLIVPAYPKKIAFAEKVALMNKNIKLLKINITSISLGFKTIREFIYKINLGMPHPQNILVAGIFFAINMHYKEACLIGANHSWHENIYVDNKNRLYFRDNFHFYDSQSNNATLYTNGLGYNLKIYEFFECMTKTFKSYIQLEEYAKINGTKIYNITENSYIDAFERK